jgi:hypothetical protein
MLGEVLWSKDLPLAPTHVYGIGTFFVKRHMALDTVCSTRPRFDCGPDEEQPYFSFHTLTPNMDVEAVASRASTAGPRRRSQLNRRMRPRPSSDTTATSAHLVHAASPRLSFTLLLDNPQNSNIDAFELSKLVVLVFDANLLPG